MGWVCSPSSCMGKLRHGSVFPTTSKEQSPTGTVDPTPCVGVSPGGGAWGRRASLTGQHQAGILHLHAPHLGLEEELEVDAFGTGRSREEACGDAGHGLRLALHEAQVVEDLLGVRLPPLQDLGDAAGWGENPSSAPQGPVS